MSKGDALTTLGPWKKGMDNAHPDYELENTFLRDGVNVDVLDSGRTRRRKGFRTVLSGTEMHSLRYHYGGDFFLLVDAGDFKRYVEDQPGVLTFQGTLASGYGDRHAPLYYAEINEELYFSDAVRTGRVLADGSLRAWGVERPAFQPTLGTVAGGLNPGTYQVALTYEGYGSEESGSSDPQTITVVAGQAIQVSAIPQPSHPDTGAICVYLSETNGETLYRYGAYPVGTTTVVLSAATTEGRKLKTFEGYPPPAGKHVEYCLGRMFIAVGNVVFFSDSLWYGLFRLAKNFYLFPADVRLMAAVDDGLYVVADRTYFIPGAGDPNSRQQEVRGYSCAERTRVRYVNAKRNNVAWFGDAGWVIASNGGQLEDPMLNTIAVPRHPEGAAMYREQNGIKQLIATVRRGTDRSSFVAEDFVEGESQRGA